MHVRYLPKAVKVKECFLHWDSIESISVLWDVYISRQEKKTAFCSLLLHKMHLTDLVSSSCTLEEELRRGENKPAQGQTPKYERKITWVVEGNVENGMLSHRKICLMLEDDFIDNHDIKQQAFFCPDRKNQITFPKIVYLFLNSDKIPARHTPRSMLRGEPF